VAAAVVAGSLFPHLQIVPCEFKPPHPPEACQGPICQEGAHDKIPGKIELMCICLTFSLVYTGCDCAWYMLDLQGSICLRCSFFRPRGRSAAAGAVVFGVEYVFEYLCCR
jgi:hypothetical protein